MKSNFLQVCLGISMVLISGSFFVRSINTANAAEPVAIKTHNVKLGPSGSEEYPFGIANGYAYWLEFNSGTWGFNKKAISEFK